MIKILFIHHRMDCGGVEKALFDLVSLLDKHIFDIKILLHEDGGEWEQKFRDAGIPVKHVYDCQKKSKWLTVKIINLLKRKYLDVAWKWGGKGALRVAMPEDYDIIVCYGAIPFIEKCFFKNAKTIKYIHGNIQTNLPYREYILRRKTSISKFDRIICVSEDAEKAFTEETKLEERIMTVFNPLDSKMIKLLAAQKTGLPTDLPLLCAVGRLSEEKGFVRLVQIHKRLLDKGYPHRLVIIGEGPEREKIEEAIHQTGTQETVILTGYQENPYPYMKQSKFMVCASYTEGLPVVAMEALSLGIPIVSSAPSVGELFAKEKCGVITENDDESLEYGIEHMLADRSFFADVKQAAERRSAFFDGKRMVREVEQVFMDLVDVR